jgi:hypothetical protein
MNQMTPARNRDGPPQDRKKSGRNANAASEDGGWTSVPAKSSRSGQMDRIDVNKISNMAHSSARRVSGFLR